MVEKRPEQKIRHVGYAEYEKMLERLLKQLNEFIQIETKKGKSFSGLYGLPRGGLPIAVHLSHHLNLPLFLEAKENCIVIDDISDSGKTLLKYKDKYPIATIFCKKKTLVVPDVYLEMVLEEDWINFPWENVKE